MKKNKWFCVSRQAGKNRATFLYLLYKLLGKKEYNKLLEDLEKL